MTSLEPTSLKVNARVLHDLPPWSMYQTTKSRLYRDSKR
jgi:hypothetical protein